MVLGMTASLNQPGDLCSQGDILHYGLFNVTERAPTTYDPRPSSINLPLQSKYASRQKNVTKSLKSEPSGSSLYINLHLCKKKKRGDCLDVGPCWPTHSFSLHCKHIYCANKTNSFVGALASHISKSEPDKLTFILMRAFHSASWLPLDCFLFSLTYCGKTYQWKLKT